MRENTTVLWTVNRSYARVGFVTMKASSSKQASTEGLAVCFKLEVSSTEAVRGVGDALLERLEEYP